MTFVIIAGGIDFPVGSIVACPTWWRTLILYRLGRSATPSGSRAGDRADRQLKGVLFVAALGMLYVVRSEVMLSFMAHVSQPLGRGRSRRYRLSLLGTGSSVGVPLRGLSAGRRGGGAHLALGKYLKWSVYRHT
ncbi:hypothetical protein [Faunimonas pinastri]|uniref:hypothetical protein n=1 Tax=Faunimonas pinastri TaxID=1855383 RepID=UPI000B878080|nr:hypothetical protein [Faunimonas pinastri]